MTTTRSDPAALQALLRQGLEQHRAGRLDDARACYQTVVQRDARNVDALHLLGTVLYQLGRPDRAVAALARAVAVNPRIAPVHNLLGSARDALGRPIEALASFDTAIGLQPGMVEAHYNRAGLLQRLGRAAEALAGYDAAIALAPGMAEAHHNRGLVLEALARPAEALASYERALALKPGMAGTWYNRGLLLGRERPADALASFERVLQLDPAFAGAAYGLGQALQRLGRHAEALEALDRAIAARSDDADAHCARAASLHELDRPAEALASLETALALRADFPEALYGHALMLHRLDRAAEALEAADRAIAAKPDDARAHQIRAVTLHDLNRLDEAIASFDHAIALDPDDREMRYRRSFSLLASGRWARGWRDYEHRWAKWGGRPGTVDEARRWTGALDPRGKTVFVFYEQGLGDTIMFSRYVPVLRARGARVLLSVQTSLAPLLAPLCDEGALVPDGDPAPDHDLQCALLDLPAAMGATPGSIPPSPPYLRADEARKARFAALLGPAARPRVGLAWSGNPTHPNDRRRSIAFERLAPLLTPEVEWICLQTDLRPADAEAFHRSGAVRWLGDHVADFADTAGLLDRMDGVVSIDTSLAHLAGAMGKRVFVMLPHAADWRWMCGRADSPWYPTARLFRQRRPGDWEGVFDDVRRALPLWLAP